MRPSERKNMVVNTNIVDFSQICVAKNVQLNLSTSSSHNLESVPDEYDRAVDGSRIIESKRLKVIKETSASDC
jgi:hypothetical protein